GRGRDGAGRRGRGGGRRAALAAGQDERGVGREVAELGIARYLDGEGRRLRPAELAGGEGGAQRLADELLNVALHSRPRGAKGRRRDAGPGRGERAWRCLYAPPGAGSNSPGGPSSARALRALRASVAPGPRRPARALSRSASPANSPGGPSSARALRALRASVAPGPPSPPAPAGGSLGGRLARCARSGRAGRGKAAPGKPSRISWGHACARALRALRCNDLPKGTGPSAKLGRTGLAASAGWTAQLAIQM